MGWKPCSSDGLLLNANSSVLPWICPRLSLQDCVLGAAVSCVTGELELFTVRKDSQSALLSLLFAPCEAPEKCFHVRSGGAGSKTRLGAKDVI